MIGHGGEYQSVCVCELFKSGKYSTGMVRSTFRIGDGITFR